MKRFLPQPLQRWGRWLMLNWPELYVMRLHILVPAAVLWLLLIWLWASSVRIAPGSIPNPEAYFMYLLVATACASVYWAYLQVLQQPMLPMRSGLAGCALFVVCAVLLIVVNAAPVLFSITLSARLAMFAKGMDPGALRYFDPFSVSDRQLRELNLTFSDYFVLAKATNQNPGSQLVIFAMSSILAFEVAALISLVRSLSPTRVALALVAILVFIGLVLMLTSSMASADQVFLPTYLGAYALCVLGFVWATWRTQVSPLTTVAVVGCILGTPLIPMVYGVWLWHDVRDPEAAQLFLTGLGAALVAGLFFQGTLNRLQAAPQ